MPSDLDIYRSAKLLIDQHGDWAQTEAVRMFDLMTERGDLPGRRLWRRLERAILEITKVQPGEARM